MLRRSPTPRFSRRPNASILDLKPMSLLPISFLLALALAPPPPELPVRSYVLIEAESGEVLAERDADQPLPPASLTKIMAAYVIFGELAAGRLGLEDPVTISEKSVAAAGFAHVRRGRPSGSGRAVAQGDDHPVGQRRDHRPRRARGRQRGGLRCEDERGGGTARDEEYPLRDCRRPARGGPCLLRARSRAFGSRRHPHSSRLLPLVFGAGIRVCRHPPEQPQSAALAGCERGRDENGPYPGGRLLPDRLGQARGNAPDQRRPRFAEREGACRSEPCAASVRLSSFRGGGALPARSRARACPAVERRGR